MNVLRGWLFDHLGLKLTALLLAVLVYLNVYTDRPATMRVAFPVEVTDLADSLALSGPPPGVVEADLKGTGKQIIALKVREPRLQLSLGGVGAGRFQRTLSAVDLPLPEGGAITVENFLGPEMIELEVEPRLEREIPVALRVTGSPASGWSWGGDVWIEPRRVRVSGAHSDVTGLDSLVLQPLRLEGRRDSVRAELRPESVPAGCRLDPAVVRVKAKLVRR